MLTELGTDQEGVEEIVGKGSNALVWPQGAPEEDETLDEREQYNNQRLMRMCTFSHPLSIRLSTNCDTLHQATMRPTSNYQTKAQQQKTTSATPTPPTPCAPAPPP